MHAEPHLFLHEFSLAVYFCACSPSAANQDSYFETVIFARWKLKQPSVRKVPNTSIH